MKIAIIGYGSLIWDLSELAAHVNGDWQRGAGPELFVEFSRLSPKRKMALVLVIDEHAPKASATSVIESSRTDLATAINDLATREHCDTDMIGFCGSPQDDTAPGSFKTRKAVANWLAKSPYDAAIWTDYGPNFVQQTALAFTHKNAERYLATLSDDSLCEAWRYITYAPTETDTPLRRYLKHCPWWQQLAKRFDDRPQH